MKTLYCTLAGFYFTIAGYSQTTDTIVKIIPRGYADKFLLFSPQSKLLAENRLGKIYSLPLDNMPCLVSNLMNSIPIPTKKLFPGNPKMPNKIPK